MSSVLNPRVIKRKGATEDDEQWKTRGNWANGYRSSKKMRLVDKQLSILKGLPIHIFTWVNPSTPLQMEWGQNIPRPPLSRLVLVMQTSIIKEN